MGTLAARTGEHPFDTALAGTWLWHWILPSWQVLARHWMRILPVALGYGVFIWLWPDLMASGIGRAGAWRQIVDSVIGSAVTAALCAAGYIALVRAEGQPWGLARVTPAQGIAERLALVMGFWLLFGLVLAWILRAMLMALAKSPSFIEFGMWLFGTFGWWTVPLVLWLFSPIGFWLATLSAVTQIRAIRGEEPIGDILVDSFQRVNRDLLAIAIPAWALSAVAIGVLWMGAEVIANGLAGLVVRAGWGIVIVFGAITMLLLLPFWFVIERVYLPELGVEEDLESSLEQAAEAAPASAPAVSLAEQLARVHAEEGAEIAARRLANWVRSRLRSQAELAALMQQLGQPEALARELAPLAVEWASASKPGELPWLVDQGMALQPQFLMDLPDRVLAVAKKLTFAERSDLASRLLLAFLKQHRTHPEHLAAGLQLARVLATHSNNLEGARKLLAQMAQIYPDDPQPAQLLKQLGLS
ncbi:MAG: tetratricopeptide repeat protein [Rhodanobacteraceae bacterium]|nr:tetratricopeptide repeat protein [Rhodanobacteraceae bacterium]